MHFYPRPPRGGRRTPADVQRLAQEFLSTPSARRATPPSRRPVQILWIFLSTPSARRATDDLRKRTLDGRISIHALREEGDLWQLLRLPDHRSISIHALREEGDSREGRGNHLHIVFLSTPSARRATVTEPGEPHHHKISIHALREEGDGHLVHLLDGGIDISIHALREEGDLPAPQLHCL